MDIAITTKEMLINDFCIRIYFLRIVSVSSASLWSCVINSSILENFSSGRVRLTKVSRMNLSYMSEWKWRIFTSIVRFGPLSIVGRTPIFSIPIYVFPSNVTHTAYTPRQESVYRDHPLVNWPLGNLSFCLPDSRLLRSRQGNIHISDNGRPG